MNYCENCTAGLLCLSGVLHLKRLLLCQSCKKSYRIVITYYGGYYGVMPIDAPEECIKRIETDGYDPVCGLSTAYISCCEPADIIRNVVLNLERRCIPADHPDAPGEIRRLIDAYGANTYCDHCSGKAKEELFKDILEALTK